MKLGPAYRSAALLPI